jgi:hypothetical protein
MNAEVALRSGLICVDLRSSAAFPVFGALLRALRVSVVTASLTRPEKTAD